MDLDFAARERRNDLTNCDREPIHIPGSVQPHGLLFALNDEGIIRHLSQNAAELLGAPLEELLGHPLADFFASRTEGWPALPANGSLFELEARTPNAQTRCYNGTVTRFGGQTFVEAEPCERLDPVRVLNLSERSRSSIARLRDAGDLRELCQGAVDEVRDLTKFDRVLIYRFDDDWNGHVLAEARNPDVAAYLDLHFPASDIPRQARELYFLKSLRLIPEVNHQPAQIVSQKGFESEGPLDLSLCFLRSVSPIHLEYLRNMRATASMSISLIKDNKLWGLISCTHQSGPRHLPFEMRSACQLIGEVMSGFLGAKEGNDQLDYRIRLKSTLAVLLQFMTQAPNFVAGLTNHAPNVMDLANAHGAAICFNGQITVVGRAPTTPQIEALLNWFSARPDREVFATDSLPRFYPPAQEFVDTACGVLAASFSRGQDNCILWFRPEVLQTVSWGGNPNKALQDSEDGAVLHPRKSFERWRETVRGKSLPWLEVEKQAANELRGSIIDIVLQRAEELTRLNTDLERSNFELDSFAYAASHDLKEPLRGIHNYASLVLEDMGDKLEGSSLRRMETVVRLTQRMESLIDSLLHYAQVGRSDLAFRETDLNLTLAHTLEMLRSRIERDGAVIAVPRPLPRVRCDEVLVGEVFANLISNAIKYNDKPTREVEVGYLEQNPTVLYVRDNGIGIPAKHFENIFRIFKRLHGRDVFGGGTGTGLTIAKKIVERHGGRLWLESNPAQGSTFFFTLDEANRDS